MSESFKVQAEARVDEGKGASRRLRRLEGKTPAIVYGGQKPPKSISLLSVKIWKKCWRAKRFIPRLSISNWRAKQSRDS